VIEEKEGARFIVPSQKVKPSVNVSVWHFAKGPGIDCEIE
jgi:hypothetical protein